MWLNYWIALCKQLTGDRKSIIVLVGWRVVGRQTKVSRSLVQRRVKQNVIYYTRYCDWNRWSSFSLHFLQRFLKLHCSFSRCHRKHFHFHFIHWHSYVRRCCSSNHLLLPCIYFLFYVLATFCSTMTRPSQSDQKAQCMLIRLPQLNACEVVEQELGGSAENWWLTSLLES